MRVPALPCRLCETPISLPRSRLLTPSHIWCLPRAAQRSLQPTRGAFRAVALRRPAAAASQRRQQQQQRAAQVQAYVREWTDPEYAAAVIAAFPDKAIADAEEARVRSRCACSLPHRRFTAAADPRCSPLLLHRAHCTSSASARGGGGGGPPPPPPPACSAAAGADREGRLHLP